MDALYKVEHIFKASSEHPVHVGASDSSSEAQTAAPGLEAHASCHVPSVGIRLHYPLAQVPPDFLSERADVPGIAHASGQAPSAGSPRIHHPLGAGQVPESSSVAGQRTSHNVAADEGGSGGRKGKWTLEEEVFTGRLVDHFNNGFLSIPDGTTLRCFGAFIVYVILVTPFFCVGHFSPAALNAIECASRKSSGAYVLVENIRHVPELR